MPDIPIAIATDMVDHPLVRYGPFDIAISLAPGPNFGSEWVTGKFQRLLALQRSPFEKTLHLDCDTRILSPEVLEVFDRMAQGTEFLATECLQRTSFCRRAYGARMFNGGVLAYKATEKVTRFLRVWQRMTRFQHRQLATGRFPAYVEHVASEKWRRKLLRMDQVSLAQIVSPTTNRLGLNFGILPSAWNDRLTPREALNGSNVLISHLASYHRTVLPDMLAFADAKQRANLPEAATVLYNAMREIVVQKGQFDGLPAQAQTVGSLPWQWRVLTGRPTPLVPEMLSRAILHNLFGQRQAASQLTAKIGYALEPAPEGALTVNFVRPYRPRIRREIA